MGIRPSLSLVFGIADLKADRHWKITDPRYAPVRDWRQDSYPIEYLDCPDDILAMPSWQLQRRISLQGVDIGAQIYWSPEYGCPEVIGIRVGESISASDPLYALAAINPALQQSGWIPIPSMQIEDDFSFYGRGARLLLAARNEGRAQKQIQRRMGKHWPGVKRRLRAYRRGWAYPFWHSEDVESWLWQARAAFAWIGLAVQAHELRLLLVCEWS